MFEFSPEMKRDLLNFANKEVGIDGPKLLDPNEYPNEKLQTDLKKTERRIMNNDKEIRQKESKREDLVDQIAEEDSDRQKKLLAQQAGDLAREMDTLNQECDKLFLRRSLIRGVQHVRSKFEGLSTDLAIDEVLEDEDHDAVAAELEDYLVEQGVQNEGLEAIMQTLDMELQRDADDRTQMTDSYAEEALKEAEQLEATKDSTKSQAEDINLSTDESGDMASVSSVDY